MESYEKCRIIIVMPLNQFTQYHVLEISRYDETDCSHFQHTGDVVS